LGPAFVAPAGPIPHDGEMVVAIWPALIAIVGLLVFVLATTNAKASEIGRIMFFCGLLVLTLVLAHQVVKLA
jgi:Na+/phosphate symporter